MHKRLNKYFWDAPAETFTEEFRVIRILEYASFPDLYWIPFDELKTCLLNTSLDKHRIPESRKKLLNRITPFVSDCGSLEEAIARYVDGVIEKRLKSLRG